MDRLNCFLDIKEYKKEGYKPLVDFESWRVAILNYIDELEPENIKFMEKHLETDEVFILLKGACILFFLDQRKNDILHINMKPGIVYNVKKGSYHTHVLSKEASLIIVENQNTSNQNSEKILLSSDQKKKIQELSIEINSLEK